jgi:hypothetical protein
MLVRKQLAVRSIERQQEADENELLAIITLMDPQFNAAVPAPGFLF